VLVFLTLQLVVPLLLLAWLFLRRAPGRIAWLLGGVMTLGAIAAASLAVPWLFVPARVGYLYLVLWVVAGVRSGLRIRTDGAVRLGRWRTIGVASQLIATVLVWAVAALAVDGRRLPVGDVLDLACPLGPGHYLVVNGGSRSAVNAHLATLADEPRYLPWRGQSFGVDLVQVDGLGRRSTRLSSPNVSDYRIYGQSVVAPCDGRVVSSEDGRPDMVVPMRDPDRSKLAGNHVILACGAYELLVGHLQPGSVRVVAGDVAKTGDLLGFAGNSGNTDEPHLHLSAQRRTAGQAPVGGDPVWVTVAGRFLVRNDVVICE
jgi:hypothetical protein